MKTIGHFWTIFFLVLPGLLSTQIAAAHPQDSEVEHPVKTVRALIGKFRSSLKTAKANQDPSKRQELWENSLTVFNSLDSAGLTFAESDPKLRHEIAEALLHGAAIGLASDASETEKPLELLELTLLWGKPDFEIEVGSFPESESEKLITALNQLEQKYSRVLKTAKRKINFLRDLPQVAGEFDLADFNPLEDEAEVISPQERSRNQQSERLVAQEKKQIESTIKLAMVAPGKPEYKFELAEIQYSRSGGKKAAIATLSKLAPESEPGHFEAHLKLAKHYVRVASELRATKLQTQELALTHLNHAVMLEKESINARFQRAALLVQLKRNDLARDDYEVLAAADPVFCDQLIEQNIILNREQENMNLLEDAEAPT